KSQRRWNEAKEAQAALDPMKVQALLSDDFPKGFTAKMCPQIEALRQWARDQLQEMAGARVSDAEEAATGDDPHAVLAAMASLRQTAASLQKAKGEAAGLAREGAMPEKLLAAIRDAPDPSSKSPTKLADLEALVGADVAEKLMQLEA